MRITALVVTSLTGFAVGAGPATAPVAIAATTTGGESSSGSAPWGWIILGLVLAAALVIGIEFLHRRRSGAATWREKAADLNRRGLVALDDVLAKGSVVAGQIQGLAAEARSLEARAPDDSARAAAADVRTGLDDLARTLESDRTLRLGSPPPTADQLSYSTALIRQQVEQVQDALLRPPSAGHRSS